MGQTQTFDASETSSIIEFNRQIIMHQDNTNVEEKLIITNLKKAIRALKETKENKRDQVIKQELLRLVTNISPFCKSEKAIQTVIHEQLYPIYLQIIDSEINQTKINMYLLEIIFSSMRNLTVNSIVMANENIRFNFHNIAIKLLDGIDMISAIRLNNDIQLNYIYTVVSFLKETSNYYEAKESFIGIGAIERLSAHIKKFDDFLNEKAFLKIIKLNIMSIFANLLNDEQFSTMPISIEIALMFNEILKDIISQWNINTLIIENTRYYVTCTIGVNVTNITAQKHLNQIILAAVSDSMKLKLFDDGILFMLEQFIRNGNEIEFEKSIELICSLCLNENVLKYVKEDKGLLELIRPIQEKTKNENIKMSCQQIYLMVNNAVDENRLAKEKKHIFLSYERKNKEKCWKINEELRKNGYRTSMGYDMALSNLEDQIADSIGNACVVLICFSFDYKKSNKCRMEAQYAKKFNKPIIAIKMQPRYEADGWLEAVLGSKLHVDFSNDLHYSVSFDVLLKQIKEYSNGVDITIEPRSKRDIFKPDYGSDSQSIHSYLNSSTHQPINQPDSQSVHTLAFTSQFHSGSHTNTPESIYSHSPVNSIRNHSPIRLDTRTLYSQQTFDDRSQYSFAVNDNHFAIVKPTEANVLEWQTEDVKNWLKKNNMGSLVNAFKTCDGITLKILWEMKQTNYNRFCDTIDREIEKSKKDVDTFEKLKFHHFLQNLFYYS